MALTDIIQQLLDQAQKDVGSIASSLESEKQSLAGLLLLEEEADLLAISDQKCDHLAHLDRETGVVVAKEKRRHSLLIKSRVMKKALHDFYEALVALDDSAYKKIMEALVLRMELKGSGVFFVPESRKSVSALVVPAGFQIQTSKDIRGGAMIKQGEAMVDIRFYNLVYSEFKTEFESFFAQKLDLIAS